MFAPGDEVVCVENRVCVDGEFLPWALSALEKGRHYTVASVWSDHRSLSGALLTLSDTPTDAIFGGYSTARFRKVQRRTDSLTIESFLTIKPGFEEPRRTPAPVPVAAQSEGAGS